MQNQKPVLPAESSTGPLGFEIRDSDPNKLAHEAAHLAVHHLESEWADTKVRLLSPRTTKSNSEILTGQLHARVAVARQRLATLPRSHPTAVHLSSRMKRLAGEFIQVAYLDELAHSIPPLNRPNRKDVASRHRFAAE